MKFCVPARMMLRVHGRSLIGNVDWNNIGAVSLHLPMMSFPYWERGLKLDLYVMMKWGSGRSLIGNVDWNGTLDKRPKKYIRRSLIGNVDWNAQDSHHYAHSWCRSLIGNVDWNNYAKTSKRKDVGSRSLIGNVDWNHVQDIVNCPRALSFPYWERGLKFLTNRYHRQGMRVVPLLGTWIEILLLCHDQRKGWCRSLIGNVKYKL